MTFQSYANFKLDEEGEKLFKEYEEAKLKLSHHLKCFEEPTFSVFKNDSKLEVLFKIESNNDDLDLLVDELKKAKFNLINYFSKEV